MFETINDFFTKASETISSVTGFIISIPGYIDWNIAMWAGIAGITIFGLLQLRKFFPEAGAFLGALALSTGTAVLGMIIRKRHDDAKPVIKRRK